MIIGTSYLLKGYDSWFKGEAYILRTNFGPKRDLKRGLDESHLTARIGTLALTGGKSLGVFAISSIQAGDPIEDLEKIGIENWQAIEKDVLIGMRHLGDVRIEELQEGLRHHALDYTKKIAERLYTDFEDLTTTISGGSGEGQGRSVAG